MTSKPRGLLRLMSQMISEFFPRSGDTKTNFYNGNWIHEVDSKSTTKLCMKAPRIFCTFFLSKKGMVSTFFVVFENSNFWMTFKPSGLLRLMSQMISEFFPRSGDTKRSFYITNWIHQVDEKSTAILCMKTTRIFCTFFL